MKIKTLSRTILYSFVIQCFTCCQEADDVIYDFTADDWKVISIKLNRKSNFEFAENEYILRFISDSTYHLNIDLNGCSISTYEMDNSRKINFEWIRGIDDDQGLIG